MRVEALVYCVLLNYEHIQSDDNAEYCMMQARLVTEKSFETFYVAACGSLQFSWKQT